MATTVALSGPAPMHEVPAMKIVVPVVLSLFATLLAVAATLLITRLNERGDLHRLFGSPDAPADAPESR